MKFPLKHQTTALLACAAILLGAGTGVAQVTVKVDTTKNWIGFMNVSELPANGGAYLFGSSWGTADLVAVFSGTSHLTLTPNTIGDPAPYWYTPSGGPGATGNKTMDANMYVEVTGALAGQDVTFTGTVLSNTLVSPYTSVAFIKDFAANYSSFNVTTAPLVDGQFSITLSTIDDPARHVQYGFETIGPNVWVTDVAPMGLVRIAVDNSDPSITGQPGNQRAIAGGNASFTVTATGGSPLRYQWHRYSTNLVNGGNISGATNATLNLSNVQLADATTYTVTVTSGANSQTTDPAGLRVLTPAEFANGLDNPSFEFDVVSPTVVPAPWVNFTGSALQNTNDLYAFNPGSNVQTIEGTNVVQIHNGGQYNGIYQDVPAVPGQIFTGDCWLWQSSLDPLLATVNEAYLEVQFRQGNANPIAIYNSILVINDPVMLDTWLFLQATNGVAAGYAQTTTTNAKYLVAPPGTDRVRFQVTLHTEGGGGGSVYVDAMRLMSKIPASVSTAISGGDLILSWSSQGATSYQVVYKDELSDATWTPVGGAVAGDGTVKTAQFPVGGSKRFYAVLTL